MLEIRSMVKEFAGVHAVDGVSLTVAAGASVGLVGPNGSGKTTLLNLISGFIRPTSGEVRLEGRDVTGRPPWKMAGLGLVRTFQLPAMPTKMSVLEVMVSGAEMPVSGSPWRSLVAGRRSHAELDAAIEEALRLLGTVGLEEACDKPAASLSGGQQKLLNLAAVLMRRPRILLLDEPTAGVSPPLRKVLADVLDKARRAGTTIVTVEHDIAFVAELCETAVVLDKGQVIAECAPRDLHLDAQVVDAYLGDRRAGRPSGTEVR